MGVGVVGVQMTAKDDLDKISKVIKEKLGQRTRAGEQGCLKGTGSRCCGGVHLSPSVTDSQAPRLILVDPHGVGVL